MKKPTGRTSTKQCNNGDYMRNSKPMRQPHFAPSPPLLPKDRQLHSSRQPSTWIAEAYYPQCIPLSPILEDSIPRGRPLGGQARVISDLKQRSSLNWMKDSEAKPPPRPPDPLRLKPHSRKTNDNQCFGSNMCANVVATLKRIMPCL